MFGYKELIPALKNGCCTVININEKEYQLFEAEQFQITDTGCSGVLGNVLAFELNTRTLKSGTLVKLSFSSINDQKVRVGEIKLLCWKEQKTKMGAYYFTHTIYFLNFIVLFLLKCSVNDSQCRVNFCTAK